MTRRFGLLIAATCLAACGGGTTTNTFGLLTDDLRAPEIVALVAGNRLTTDPPARGTVTYSGAMALYLDPASGAELSTLTPDAVSPMTASIDFARTVQNLEGRAQAFVDPQGQSVAGAIVLDADYENSQLNTVFPINGQLFGEVVFDGTTRVTLGGNQVTGDLYGGGGDVVVGQATGTATQDGSAIGFGAEFALD